MRRSHVLLSAVAASGAIAAKLSFDRKVAEWDTNPDPTGGDPLRLPEGETLWTTAPDGARLHGHRCGDRDGHTVVLVHGFIESIGFWGPVTCRLADAGFDVVSIDQRGHGRSERGEADYAVGTLASDLRAWYETHDLGDTTLVGHSMGGVAAMAFAAHEATVANERVRSQVLVTTLASPVRVSGMPNIDIDAHRVMRTADRFLARRDLGLFALLGTFGSRPARAALEATRAGFLGTDLRTRAHAFEMLQDFDLGPVLPSITLPTSVVAGSEDGLTPVATNEAIADAIPGAQFHLLPGRGHMLPFEAPDELTDLIVQATKPVDA